VHSENRAAGQGRRSFIEQARRAQIVRGAIETIAELGYGQASFARIAKRAGVSPALISYHFAGKDELIRQIVADVTEEMRAEVSEHAAAATCYADALRLVIEGQVRYFAGHQTDALALHAISRAAEPGPREAFWIGRSRSLAEIEELLRAGQRAGEFRDFLPRVAAASIMASLEAVPAELRAQPGVDVGRYAGELATLYERATRRTS
jgi:AcrR family transcriptional regulator